MKYSRPPVTGLTTELWLNISPTLVRLDRTIATQDTRSEWVEAKAVDPRASHCGDPYPHIVVVDGLLLVEDGHHRRQFAINNGLSHMFMRVHYMLPARCYARPGQIHFTAPCGCFRGELTS